MKRKHLLFLLLLAAFTIAIGWMLASNPSSTEKAANASPNAAPSPSSASGKAGTTANATSRTGWTPPTGDPLERYRAGKTPAERMQIISDFITLGHERNVAMLRDAIRDPDAKVRMLALESAASMLTPDNARDVYLVSGASADPDIRTMTWSFLASHPMENRAAVYGEVLASGPDAAFEETLAEMGRTPEMPLFETMLHRSLTNNMPAPRAARLLQELNAWLKPGGGEVPEFKSLPDLQSWWQANRQRYDQFMLRVDQ